MTYLLTQTGRERLDKAFVDPWGDHRIYDSVTGLNRRTVSKIMKGRDGARLASLQVLFAACALVLEHNDYCRCVSPVSPPVANVNPAVEQEILQPIYAWANEPVGGAMPLASSFYLERAEDPPFHVALARGDSIIRIKGQHQTGKTSLMARGLKNARQAGAHVIVTDCRNFEPYEKQSAGHFYQALTESIADQLGIEPPIQDGNRSLLAAGPQFQRFVQREILARDDRHVVWAIDDADALFTLDYHSDLFGRLRSWHEARATLPNAGWDRLTLILSYSSDAHLFIPNLNLSPFNVGTRLSLNDFTREQVHELNKRYGSPLHAEHEIPPLYDLVGGHPFLVRRCLYEIAQSHIELSEIETREVEGHGIFGDYLDRMRAAIHGDSELCGAVQALLCHTTPISKESFQRLRSAGVLTGASPQDARFRCRLFEEYLKIDLL